MLKWPNKPAIIPVNYYVWTWGPFKFNTLEGKWAEGGKKVGRWV